MLADGGVGAASDDVAERERSRTPRDVIQPAGPARGYVRSKASFWNRVCKLVCTSCAAVHPFDRLRQAPCERRKKSRRYVRVRRFGDPQGELFEQS